MPIFDYLCEDCNFRFDKFIQSNFHIMPPCPMCNSQKTVKVPSLTGYRRDHTMVGG